MRKEKNKMTNLLLKSALIVLITWGLFACNKQENVSTDEVIANVSAGIKSRASDTQWAEGDGIGLMMFGSGADSLQNKKFNSHYITQAGDGLFTPGSTDNVILYPGDGSLVDFIGYYPYAEEPDSFLLAVDVHDQTELPLIDLMTSDRFEGASKNNPNVLLHFHHRLTKLVFNFKLEDETAGTEIESFIIKGMLTKATYDMLTNVFEYDEQSEEEIEMPIDQDSYDYPRSTAIVLPREAGGGVVFHIKMTDGREYEVSLVDDLDLETATMYIFNIRLRDRETPPTISAAVIEPWREVEDINLESTPLVIAQEPGETKNFKNGDKITLYDINGKLSTFTYDGNKTWTPDEPVYWENIGDKVSEKVILRAEFIRTAALNATQMPEVFLAELEVKRFDPVHFEFDIVPAKVVFVLKSDFDGDPDALDNAEYSSEELAKATITLPGYIKGYTLVNGVFTPGESTTSTDVGDINLVAEGGVEALIVPQSKKGLIAKIKIGAYTYEVNKDNAAIEFIAGKICELTVNITKTEVPSFSATYTDWEETDPVAELNAIILTDKTGETLRFEEDDEMTLFYNYDSEAITKVGKSNFVYKGNHTWTSTPLAYWEELDKIDDSKAYNFYAVSVLNPAPIGSNQMPDIMYATTTAKQFGVINLEFTRETAKVFVELRSEDGTYSAAELATADIYLPKYRTGATFNPNAAFSSTQPYTPGTVNTKDVKLVGPASQSSLSWNGLIEPQTIAQKNNLIKITIAENDYYISIDTDMVYEKGKYYTLKVNIKKTGLYLSASYVDWENGGDVTDIETELD